MNDYPATPSSSPSEYGSLDGIPDKLKSCIEECHDELTVNQLRQCREYFSQKISSFQNALESSVTIEDFEKAKKQDIDGDNEAGETGSY